MIKGSRIQAHSSPAFCGQQGRWQITRSLIGWNNTLRLSGTLAHAGDVDDATLNLTTNSAPQIRPFRGPHQGITKTTFAEQWIFNNVEINASAVTNLSGEHGIYSLYEADCYEAQRPPISRIAFSAKITTFATTRNIDFLKTRTSKGVVFEGVCLTPEASQRGEARVQLVKKEEKASLREEGFQEEGRMSQVKGPEAIVEEMRRSEGEGLASTQALADDAIIWASLHGLVHFSHLLCQSSILHMEQTLCHGGCSVMRPCASHCDAQEIQMAFSLRRLLHAAGGAWRQGATLRPHARPHIGGASSVPTGQF